MPIGAVALLLGAAVAHAAWNYFAKGARNDGAFNFAYLLCTFIVYLPVAAIAFVVAPPDLTWKAALFVVVSAFLHIAYYFLLTRGYQYGDLSLVYPLARGTGPVLTVIGAILIYDEEPAPIALVGTAFVVAGIIAIAWPPKEHRVRHVGISISFALATGGAIAAYSLWDKTGVDLLSPITYAFGIDTVRLLLFAPFVLATAQGREGVQYAWREERRAVLAVGILGPGAYMMVLAALTLAPVSYVAPAREISIVFGTILGARLLGEANAARRIAGATAIVAGVFALAAA
jgi:drug/metabolite transporter (DMT)-like permease